MMELTKQQRRAIEHAKGNLQLIACAGSGKTEVVAQRVATLLTPKRSGGCVPGNIVAFTFTEKAAAELKERIVARCRDMHGPINGLAEMYVGTIHAYALDLLKTHVPEYLKYEVLNEIQQVLFVDRHSRESGLTLSTDLKGAPLRRYVDTGHYVRALSILREDDFDPRALRSCSVAAGLESYRTLLQRRRYFDYSSILECAVKELTTNRALQERLRGRLRHVIVDEYQDVNPIQEALVNALHDLGAHVCVVGDDDQTIYQWRGSDVGKIVTFKKRYPKVEQIRLEENFRSSTGVVESARDFIALNDPDRLEKAMKPTGAQDDEPGDLVVLQFDTPQEEAAHIVETIQALRGVAVREGPRQRGISWSDMAILLRSVRASGEPITAALDAAKVPYVVAGMNNLFDTAEAEAARRLFYFLGSHTTRTGLVVTEASLEEAWKAANLGLATKDLRTAIAGARAARDGMAAADEGRWSVYNLQRQFLEFIETAGVREERVPTTPSNPDRAAIVFYNLGKFSQVISDYESIHFRTAPTDKYASFAKFLEFGAQDAYPEGWQNNQYANPDAVRIMTVHQAKGMQWPVVFVPQVLRNRFPSRKFGGRTTWHLVPREAVTNQARYEGSLEDERRLFYVAMTRSQKFLHVTAGLRQDTRDYKQGSEFLDDIRASKWFKRKKPDYSKRKRLRPTPKSSIANVVLSFSDIKYFFECPYQFKLRILFGFNPPIHEALGYGKSLHDALAEVHQRAMDGVVAAPSEAPSLVQTHLHVPYAYPKLKETLTTAAERVVAKYIADNQSVFRDIEFAEKTVEVNLGDGVSVVGRIDLVRRKSTDETTIVDLKSNDRTQSEEITETQLHTYALGYEELTGRRPDYVETYDLDRGKKKPRPVDDDFIDGVKTTVKRAASALRAGKLEPEPKAKTCANCDYLRMCTSGLKAASQSRRAS